MKLRIIKKKGFDLICPKGQAGWHRVCPYLLATVRLVLAATIYINKVYERLADLKRAGRLICVNKKDCLRTQFLKNHCGMKKSPYLCIVKRNKGLATRITKHN